MSKAADEFLQRCTDSETLPDVFEFLGSQVDLSERAQLDVLLIDQFQRWKQNQVIPVDQYLDRTPQISDVLKVELLIEEYGYLEQRGIAPPAVDFASRYTGLSLDAQQELCDALEIDSSAITQSGSKPGSTESKASSALESQPLIGRYQIIRVLGKGSFGKVYLAKDPDLDRSVAIKVPTDKRIKLGGGAEEFLQEARAVAKLDHPNIVPVYDCGITDENHCFVVSKYIRGKELRTELRKGISHREAAQITCQLARALHTAHVAGIVHRDVKPGNVMIDAKRKPHLLDFGLAFSDHNADQSGAVIGTPAYMSPEQAEGGSHRVDGRSDIYSLAVVFYEMLTGHRPCRSGLTDDILMHLKMGEVRPPRQSDDSIPAELEAICLKALSRKLSDRYSTAKDMADDLENWLLESSDCAGVELATGSAGSFSSSTSHRSTRSSTASGVAQPSFSVSRWFNTPAKLMLWAILLALVLIVTLTKPPWQRFAESDGSRAMAQQSSQSPGVESESDLAVDDKLPRVAVLGFRDLSDSAESAWISTALVELLTEELGKSDQLKLVSCENVALMKADLDIANSEALGSSALDRIRNRLDADWVVLGSYQPQSEDLDGIRLSVRMQNTSQVDDQFQSENLADESHWRELVTTTGAQLRRKLNVDPPNIAAVGQLYPAAPEWNAAKDYFEGIASLRTFDPRQAKLSFERAAKLAPDSALVHDGLARAAQQLGDEEAARVSSAKAVELSASLPDHMRLKILGRHHLLIGKTAEAVASYRALFESGNQPLENRLLLAAAMTTAGQGWQAMELLDQAREEPLTDAATARLNLAAADAAQSVSEFSRQLAHAKSATAAAEQVSARLLQGLAMLSQGQAYRRVGDHGQAVICFDQAVKRLTEHGDQRSAATAVAAWAKALVDHGQLDEAEDKIESGLELSKALGNQRLLARFTGQLGEVNIYRGKFADAEMLLTESLAAFTKLGDRQGIADMNLTLANVKARTGKFDEAIEMVAAARKAFQASGDRRGEGRTWGQQGAMIGRQGNVTEARRHFERALELFREVGDRRGIATCLGDLATTHSNLGQLTKAGELYSEALELLRQMNSQRGPEMIMYNLSNLYARTGRLEEAEALMAESLKRYQDQEKAMNACFVQRKLADIQLRRGNLQQAKSTLAAAQAQSEAVGSLDVQAQALATSCDISIFEGQFDQAKQQIQSSQELSRQLKQELSVAACDLTLAQLALRSGAIEQANELFRKFEPKIVPGKPELKPMLLFFQSQLQAAAGNPSGAEKSQQMGDLATEENQTEDVLISLRCRLERARALAAIDQVESADKELQSVIKLAESFGWIALKLEAQIERLESLVNAKQPVDPSDISQLKSEAMNRGFIDFAERAGKLLK